MTMPDILHKFKIQAPIQRVFDAFCTADGLNAWWTLTANGEPQVGEPYTFFFGPDHDWRAEVTHVIPGKELTWRMTSAMNDWIGTEVGFTLTSEDQGTCVLFFHKGWKEASNHFAITNFCWGQLLNGLKRYVEEGIIIPFNLRN